jgi:hypothetical protein
MVHEIPTRADLAKAEKLAKRMLNFHKQQEVRVLAKNYLWLVHQMDLYVESMYPCFEIVETQIRQNRHVLEFDADGVFRLKDPQTGKHLFTGQTLKDLFLNAVLWGSDWPSDEEFKEICQEEDQIAGLEPIDETDSGSED